MRVPTLIIHRSSRRRGARGFVGAIALALGLAAVPASAQFGQAALPPPPPDRKAPPAGEPHGTELRSTLRVTLESAPVAQAAMLGGAAYVPLRDGRFVSVDLEAGRVRWSIDLPTGLPAVAAETFVVVAGDEMLTAVAPDSTVKWQLPLPGGFSAPPVFAGGWLIVGAAGGDVLCLRAADGKVLWTQRVAAALQAGAAISGETVYLGLADGTVAAHRLTDGTPIWQRKLGGPPSPILALDDRLFVGSKDKYFYCLDTKDGDQRWRWRTGGTIVGSAAVDEHRVYFVALDNVLRALDRKGGSQRWKAGLPLRPSGGPLLIGTVIAVAGVSAEVQSYVAATGKAASHYQAQADLAAAPMLLVGQVPELSAVLLLTREGGLELLRRQLEPAIVPLDYVVGAEVPFDAPPPATTP
jgi:outer membrane protein assembly factor BamB